MTMPGTLATLPLALTVGLAAGCSTKSSHVPLKDETFSPATTFPVGDVVDKTQYYP